MKANKTEKNELQRFLEQYLKNRQLADTPQSYAEFLKGEGRDAKSATENSFRAALSDYQKEQPTYGASAEALAGDGLLKSGYAARLKERADAKLAEAKEKVYTEQTAAEKKQRAAYADYLTDYKNAKATTRTEEQRRREEIVETIVKYEITDYDKARAYAEGLGFGDQFTRELFDAAIIILEHRNALGVFAPYY